MIDYDNIALLLEDFTIELTEAQLEFLIENRIEFIKTANKDKISTEHDPESSSMTSDKIVDHIAGKIDPTTRKEHTQWLVNRYKQGDFKLSDSKDLKKVMSKFEEARPYLANKNLNDIKTISDLKDHVATATSKLKSIKADSSDGEAQTMPEVFKDEHSTGYMIPNKATSIKNYGPAGKMAKTSWCTASNGNNNMFNGYKGGKYTLHLDNGAVLQLHHQSGQMMDEHDKDVDVDENPRYKDFKNTIHNFVEKTHELEGHPESKILDKFPMRSDNFQKLLDHHEAVMSDPRNNRWSQEPKDTYNAIENAARRNADISDHQFEQLKHIRRFSDDYKAEPTDIVHDDLTHSIAANKFAKPEHLDKIATDMIDSGAIDSYKSRDLINNKNVSDDTHHKIISNILNDKTTNDHETVRRYVTTAYLKPEHLERLEHLPDVKRLAAMNLNATIPESFMFGSAEDHMINIANRDDTTPAAAKFILDNAKTHVPIQNLVNSKHTPKDVLFDGLHKLKFHPDHAVNFNNIINREDLDDSDIHTLIDRHMSGTNNSGWHGFPYNSTRLTRDHIKAIINHPDFGKLDKYGFRGLSVLTNPKFKSDDLDKVIDNDKENQITTRNILNSPALKSKHIDKLISKRGMSQPMASLLMDENDQDEDYLSKVTPEHLHSVLDHPDVNTQLKHKVFHNPSVQLSHFDKVKTNPRFFGAITSSENAPPSILHSLATSPMGHVRQNIAENPNTENRTYQILKNDQDPEIAKIANKKLK